MRHVRAWLGALFLSLLAACSDPSAPVDAGTDALAFDTGHDAAAAPDSGHDAYVAPVDVGTDAGNDGGSDAGNDGGSDAGSDGGHDASTCTTTLLTGGTDVTTQGWTVVMQAPATITNGPDYVQLATSTPSGASVSGQLLLTRPGTLTPGTPFRLRVEMLVQSGNAHNPLDSAAAILGSLTGTVGNGAERAQMIYLDGTRLGWADDSGSFTAAISDGAYHVYELSVTAAGVATVTIDGTAALTRNGYTTNGTIAVGDQTNDPHVDAVTRIRSISLICP